jgi:hypothetical protein
MRVDDEVPQASPSGLRIGKEVMKMAKGTGMTDTAARVKQLILGTKKHYPNEGDKLTVGGATFTVSALTKVMQDFVDQREAVEASKATTRANVENERNQAPSRLAVIRAFETVVRGTFGNSADVLAEFGLAPRKARAPLTAEKVAAAAAKRLATREARHTMGKNQKKSVKGAVKATLVVTPLGGSPPVATPPAPTGNAPSGGTTPHSS